MVFDYNVIVTQMAIKKQVIEARSFAKLNLTLEITGSIDEFHTIKSLFQKVDFCDLIKIEFRSTGIDKVYFSTPIRSKTSTVDKAIALFKERTGIKEHISVYVEKRIPMGSGLGGGSSNAATVLLLLNKIFKEPLSKAHLIEIGALVGKDVPFFLNGPTAVVSHFGEVVEEITPLKNMYFLLVHPVFYHRTKEMYTMFNEFNTGYSDGSKTKTLVEVISSGNYDAKTIDKLCYNDFEKMLLEKSDKFREFKSVVETIAEVKFHLTGSGSTIFAVFDTKKEAEKVKTILDKFKFRTDLVKSLI